MVLMGSAGLTPAVLDEIHRALDDHELIKVRIVAEDRAQRETVIHTICQESGASLVQAIGKIALLFRRSRIEKKRRIALP